MSTAATALRSRVERMSIAVSADALAVAGLTALTIILVAATWGTWGDLDSDSGYDIVAGTRLAHGDLPYADFAYYYGPLAPALTGLAALIGGSGFGPAIVLGFAIALALLAATYLLARSYVGVMGASIATAITAAVAFIPNNYSFVLPHTFSATLGTLFLLGFLLGARRFADTEKPAWLVTAGVLVGMTLLTKPEPAAAALIAGAAWIALRARAGKTWQRELALFGLPLLAIPTVVYGAFLSQLSAHALFLENLYPRQVLDAGGDVLVRVRMPLTVGSGVELGSRVLLYVIGICALALVAGALRRSGAWRRSAGIAGVLFALAAIAASIVNPEALRHGLEFVYAWIPGGAAVAVVLLLIRFRRRSGEWSADAQADLLGVIALAVVAGTTYGAFFLHAPHPQMAVYYAPLAAVFLVRLHIRELARTRQAVALGTAWLTFVALAGLGLTIKDSRAESFTVHGAGGSLAETPSEGRLYQQGLALIAQHTKPGEPIFVAPMMTGLYTLSGHQSPLRELSIIPGALPTQADERAAIARLDDAGVRLVLTDDREWPGYGHTFFGGSFDRTLAVWITTHFDRIAAIRIPPHITVEGSHAARTLVVWTRRKA